MATVTVVVALTVAGICTALMAGAFFGFSTGVMPGLDGIEPSQAVAAMRRINDRIQNPGFLSAFVLAPLASVVAGGLLLAAGSTLAAVAAFAAAAVYALGAFATTAAINVPMNLALDASTSADEETWAAYSRKWTRWNSVRGLASVVSLVLLGWAVYAYAAA
ncbi:MAG TPA: anthrone oxygenase family protein [Stackebrandtia sp.]|jgi:uncharacterized membrane protein|uniref:anthrone oxygenase family protein n=1 Tax=Stackebrandtia sp. TaxID=2023065 RepID=UPI002D6BD851|nr:anthrone oxygenase family protein [Stackebrandtia sp.]HZE39184.1 anthrone oxygenase family protein [Stackebrandtia sp.]